MGIHIREVLFFRFLGNKAIHLGIWVDWTLVILFIFCATKGCTPKLLLFVYIRIRRDGVIWTYSIFSYRF